MAISLKFKLYFVLYFTLFSIIKIISAVNSNKCPYCDKQFINLGRHSWRCTQKTTSNININNVSSNVKSNIKISPNIYNSNSTNDYTINMVNNLITCCCGKSCKGRKGLLMHQRSCKMHKSLQLSNNTNEEEDNANSSVPSPQDRQPSPPLSDQPSSSASTPSPRPFIKTEIPLLGVKLPKTITQWAEANIYFQLHQHTLPNFDNIDEFTIAFQTMIYNYFASNYGNFIPQIESSHNINQSTKAIKKELKQLKSLGHNNHRFDNQIKSISKTLRTKLASTKSTKLTSKPNITNQLSRRFWWSCKKIFAPMKGLIPLFDSIVCKNYFISILNDAHLKKHQLPTWIQKLPQPKTPCDTSPPSYHEISAIIRKCKAKSSPCPLDQISIIPFKKCPILRTILLQLLSQCWLASKIPSCWKKGFTILIHKKGDALNPSNFRPITLQPTLYKIFSTFINKRIYNFLEINSLINKNIQKGFYPKVDGLTEHTQLLTHMLKDAKKHQRSIIVTLLDLQNAFGEVSHNLISSTLDHHHIPSQIRNLIKFIYTDYAISVSGCDKLTPPIAVKRGVLQGDPVSPLLFNLCFNPLMKIIEKTEYQQCGYLWGPTANLKSRAWLQFADDTAIIANSTVGAQKLIDINQAWCDATGMCIRIDKCCTFGMRKRIGNYEQFPPRLTIDDKTIPQIEINSQFEYLGKIYDFKGSNTTAKERLVQKLKKILAIINELDTTPQWKLEILRKFVPSQFAFELRTYNVSLTWISNSLDPLIVESVRNWLSLPISSCLSEYLSLPFKSGGLNVRSLKNYAESLRVKLRYYLKSHSNDELKCLWSESFNDYIKIDNMLPDSSDIKPALNALINRQQEADFLHLSSLRCQGIIVKAIRDHIPTIRIAHWSKCTTTLPEILYKFVRKALIQQLPTNANLFRWKKSSNALCPLCNFSQTNKHVLSNCGSIAALKRYTTRHNKILSIILEKIKSLANTDVSIYADLEGNGFRPLSYLFKSLRPDVALLHDDTIEILELTVCHESNFATSKEYKIAKYSQNLHNNLRDDLKTLKIIINTFEISPLGFFNHFKLSTVNFIWNDDFNNSLIKSVISSSYGIYCDRNTN